MDSVNSGSINSSSGGEDDYNTSSFLSLPTVTLSSSISHNPTPPSLFDPFSHSYNLDPVWPDPAQHQNYQNTHSAQVRPTSTGPLPRPNQTFTGPVKNPRKRTRASSLAPTTVLTTDTSNFRQMVQEFTGIPAPPFSATSSPPFLNSGRLDLLGQLYPLRPTAQHIASASIANATHFVSTNATPVVSSNATPDTTNTLFSTNQFLGFTSTNRLQNQLFSNQSLMFESSKNTYDHINNNFSTFLSAGKMIGTENNYHDGVLQENNVNGTRNEENGINSWNYSQGL